MKLLGIFLSTKERNFENGVLQTKVFGPQNGFTIPMCYYFHVPVPSTSKLIVKMVFCFFALSCSYACTKASNLTVHLNSKCI